MWSDVSRQMGAPLCQRRPPSASHGAPAYLCPLAQQGASTCLIGPPRAPPGRGSFGGSHLSLETPTWPRGPPIGAPLIMGLPSTRDQEVVGAPIPLPRVPSLQMHGPHPTGADLDLENFLNSCGVFISSIRRLFFRLLFSGVGGGRPFINRWLAVFLNCGLFFQMRWINITKQLWIFILGSRGTFFILDFYYFFFELLVSQNR